jgi:hypothetical protein
LFGHGGWKRIAQQQRQRQLAPGDAGRRYLDLYIEGLHSLGYETVLRRAALREQGGLVYHLVFATSNAAGKSIMEDALTRAEIIQLPLQF